MRVYWMMILSRNWHLFLDIMVVPRALVWIFQTRKKFQAVQAHHSKKLRDILFCPV